MACASIGVEMRIALHCLKVPWHHRVEVKHEVPDFGLKLLGCDIIVFFVLLLTKKEFPAFTYISVLFVIMEHIYIHTL